VSETRFETFATAGIVPAAAKTLDPWVVALRETINVWLRSSFG
jgi:hypothetical protein